MPSARPKRRRKTAFAIIHFTSARNPEGKQALCIYAQCQFSDNSIGPIWGHSEASVRAALSELTRNCDCPATYHCAREFSGKRITSR